MSYQPAANRYASIAAALKAARRFRRDYGSRGYVYQACPCLNGPGYFVAVYGPRMAFLGYV